ncbi:MAG: hypothetical protein GY749_37340 [Desulfobacteraceae bacterium]|nr:hypothetical protein [Desulfobacteraceae bacterium]
MLKKEKNCLPILDNLKTGHILVSKASQKHMLMQKRAESHFPYRRI